MQIKEESETDITDEKQKNWLFQKGESGNPSGRPKGSFSIKTKIIKELEDNPDKLDAMIDSLIKNQPALILQMIDGRPPQTLNQNVKETPIINIVKYSME